MPRQTPAGASGNGVVGLIDLLLADDLAGVRPNPRGTLRGS
ncbi:MAG: hypothetical protein U0804_23105 [Gemmataceae bacterium]